MADASTWRALAEESADAGRALRLTHVRSSISRSYHAVYLRCSGLLEEAGFEKGRLVSDLRPRDSYAHAEIPRLLAAFLTAGSAYGSSGVGPNEVADLLAAVRRLYRWRVLADYDPDAILNVEDAAAATALASEVLEVLDRWA